MNKFIFFSLFLWIFVLGCGNALYDKTQKIPNSIWLYNQPLSFSFEISDTTQLYDLVLYVSHSTEFDYQNFYTLLQVDAPNQEKPRIDTVSVELSDAVGAWYGQCSGQNCETPITFLSQTKFSKTGKYDLKFEQFSRQDSLAGIHSLRLAVIKTMPKKNNIQ